MRAAALVLGAGKGERFRASLVDPACAPAAKALLSLAGRSLLAHAIDALCAVEEIELVTPVLSADALAHWPELRRSLRTPAKLSDPVLGGAERQDSMRAGLASLPAELQLVAIHDAARPLVRPRDIARVVAEARVAGAAILATPVRDTIHRVEGGALTQTPERATLWAAQTPQVFRRDWLEAALAKATAEGWVASDEAGLLARFGLGVRVVEGDETNLKITTAADLVRAEAILRERGGAA